MTHELLMQELERLRKIEAAAKEVDRCFAGHSHSVYLEVPGPRGEAALKALHAVLSMGVLLLLLTLPGCSAAAWWWQGPVLAAVQPLKGRCPVGKRRREMEERIREVEAAFVQVCKSEECIRAENGLLREELRTSNQARDAALEQTRAAVARGAAQLDAYRQQMEEMKTTLFAAQQALIKEGVERDHYKHGVQNWLAKQQKRGRPCGGCLGCGDDSSINSNVCVGSGWIAPKEQG